jgi:hypothetical protein
LKLSERKIEPVYSIEGLKNIQVKTRVLAGGLHHIKGRHTPIRFAPLVVEMESVW